MPPPATLNGPGGSQPPYVGHQPQSDPAPAKRSWVRRHKVLSGIAALVLVGAVGSAFGGSGGTTTTNPAALASPATPPPIPPEQAAANSSAAGNAPVADGVDDNTGSAPTTAAPTTQPKPKPKPRPQPPTQPAMTTGQEQAVGAAKDYLDTAAFSRAGLIEQLSSSYGSGFSKADATFAVDYLHVNWKEQAVLAAKEYLETGHFSRAGLIQQLSSAYGSKFTRAEATYAVDRVGL